MFAIERVRLANGEPVALERGAYAADAFPGLLDERLDGSLYELIGAATTRCRCARSSGSSLALARGDEAEALGIDAARR